MMALDMDKLRKVRALMDGGKTAGECAAARRKAEAIAAKAGMTLKAALSKLDATAQPQARQANPFAGFDDWMEEKEPGYKIREAARRAKREAERRARCAELLKVYGSEDAVFAPTDLEAALRDALVPFEEEGTLWGYRDFVFHKGPTPEMWTAMRAAVRVPDTMPEALAAYQAQEALSDARCAFEPCYNPWGWVSVWTSALEYLLDRLRTPSAEGITARLDWMDILANRESTRGIEADKALIAALRSDFATFAASVQTGQANPRPVDRAATIRDLLATSPRLSDREIARRVGCSPQTVGNWRKKVAA